MSSPRNALKRLALQAYDMCAVAIAVAVLDLGCPRIAFAYVDPSVMTYTIQALAGVAVALSAVIGVAFRRSRKALKRMLGIDENAGKLVEPPVHRVEGGAVVRAGWESGQASGAGSPKKPNASGDGKRVGFSPRWPWRFAWSLAVAVFFVLSAYVVSSYEVLAGNQSSLVFGLDVAWQPIAQAGAVAALVLAIVASLLRGRAFNVALSVLFAVGLCCYIQAMALNGGLPTTDGRPIDWNLHRAMALISLAVWAAVISLVVVLSTRHKKAMQGIMGIASVALIVVQGVAVASLFSSNPPFPNEDGEAVAPASAYNMTDKGLFEVSPGNNVIVFVLDTYDTTDMMTLLENDPEMGDKLAGFTWFRNSVGAMSPTRYGIPYLLTGEYPSADEPLEEYIGDRYRDSTFLDDLEAADFSIGLYTDTLADMALTDSEKRDLIYDKTVNIVPPSPEFQRNFNAEGAVRSLLLCSLYRNMPWVLKPFVYFTTDGLNASMVNEEKIEKEADTPYLMDDAAWYQKLEDVGLSFEAEPKEGGAFRFIHLLGTHNPYLLNADGTHSEYPTSLEDQAHGSMTMVVAYIDKMRELGVFDDATIIITADHGIWWESHPGPLPWVSSALTLVKPAGQSGDVGLAVSDAEITGADLFPTMIQAAGGDVAKYGGATIFERNEQGRDRRYILTHCVTGVDQILVEYRIVGDVLDMNSWSETGVTWDPSSTSQP